MVPIFKKKKCSYLHNNLNFPSLKESKNCKISLRLYHTPNICPRPPTAHRKKTCTTVSATNYTYSPTPHFARFLTCNYTFTTIGQCRFFYFWDRSWYSDESGWKLHVYSLFGQPGFCLISILNKNKGFQELYWKCLLHLLPLKNLV